MATAKDAIDKIVGTKPRGTGRLPDPDPRPAITGSRGIGLDTDDTGSIASPLTEISLTYYDTEEIYSSDGRFVIQFQQVMEEYLRDANGNDVVINRQQR